MASSLSNPVLIDGASGATMNNVWAMRSVVVDGQTYLITGGNAGVGVAKFDTALGTLTATENIEDGGTDATGAAVNSVSAIHDLEVIQSSGSTWVVTGAQEGAVTVFSMDTAGTLTLVESDTDGDGAGSNLLSSVHAIASATVNGTTYLYGAGNDDSIEVWEFDTATGGLTYRADLSVLDDNGTAGQSEDISKLANMRALDTVEAGGKTYLAAASNGDQAITLFTVAGDGTLTSVDVEHHGLTESGSTVLNDLNEVWDIEFVTVGNKTFMLTSEAAANGAIQVFELDTATDTFTNVFSLVDGGLDAAGATVGDIARIEDLSVVENDFGTFVFAASKNSDSTSIFKLDSAGGLTLDHQMVEDGSTNLTDSFSGIVFTDEDSTNYYAQGGSNGITTSSFTPCFAAGTLIETPKGPVPVETLRPGDRVLTHDRGPQPVLWTGLSEVELDHPEHPMRPIRIPRDAFAQGVPARPVIVSPQHHLLLCGEGGEVLVPAKALVRWKGLRVMRGARRVTYVHLLLPRHEILISEGLFSESFLPGPYALGELRAEHRRQILALRPDIAANPAGQRPARPVMAVKDAERHRRRLLPVTGPVLEIAAE